MKRLALVVLVCFIATSSMAFGPSSHTVWASGLRYKSVSLESLGIVQADSFNSAILTPDAPGQYRGVNINSGVRLNNGGCYSYGQAEFHLGGKYDELVGTVYDENSNTSGIVRLFVYDSSNPNNKRVLLEQDVPGLGQVQLHLRVRGVSYLTVANGPGGTGPACGSAIDIVARLTSGTQLSTQVVPRYPTSNAGVPANSSVLFGWQTFPRATNYALHIWLVGLSGATALKPTTPFSFSASVYHKTSYTWNDHGFLPGTYQYSLLPLDDQGHNLASWSAPTQIVIASS